MKIPDDLSSLETTKYDYQNDPVHRAAYSVAVAFAAAREVFIARRQCPDAFPDYHLPIDDMAVACSAIAKLLDAGWTPPKDAQS